jgi:uncharacterized membrane protein (DUF4010 family)
LFFAGVHMPFEIMVGICIALGIGLLIGAERERQIDSAKRRAAGIRTFTVVSLMGAIAMALGGSELLFLAVFLVGLGAVVAYQKTSAKEPGLTTEFALVLTCMLGGMAIREGLIAAGVGVVLALLLAARSRIHNFVSQVLTQRDLDDTLLFAAMALIALPLAPDRFMGPFDAINPRALTQLIVLFMAVSAAGYVGIRWMGPRLGLAWVGFASGFVSSAATIYAMGQRARADPSLLAPAAAGAVGSSVSTLIQMALVIGLLQSELLLAMAWPLLMGSAVSVLYGFVIYRQALQLSPHEQLPTDDRAFDLKTALGLPLFLGGVMVAAAGLNAWLGDVSLLAMAGFSGLVDAHATAASAASLLASGKIEMPKAMQICWVGFTSNALTKAVLAWRAGDLAFAKIIIPGQVLVVASVWLAYGWAP